MPSTNEQAHPPPEAGATGGTTKAVGGRVLRLVGPFVRTLAPTLLQWMKFWAKLPKRWRKNFPLENW